MNRRIWLAEGIGTFALVFVGIAAISSGADVPSTAFAFGLTVSVMIAAVGPLSFAHFNPAVTVGFFLMHRVTLPDLLGYWSAQLSGSVAGLLALRGLYGEQLDAVGYGATLLAPGVSIFQGIVAELILTFFLMFVIATCVIQKQALTAVYIGSTVVVCAIAGSALTGASMNPARSFAPALLSGRWEQHWLYWLGPILGSGLATLVAQYLWRASSGLETAQSPALQKIDD